MKENYRLSRLLLQVLFGKPGSYGGIARVFAEYYIGLPGTVFFFHGAYAHLFINPIHQFFQEHRPRSDRCNYFSKIGHLKNTGYNCVLWNLTEPVFQYRGEGNKPATAGNRSNLIFKQCSQYCKEGTQWLGLALGLGERSTPQCDMAVSYTHLRAHET